MDQVITATRYHDFSAGHRVYGHEIKCRHLHGHNYRVTWTVGSLVGLDTVGRVVDFGVINEKLCQWLEHHWDHRMLLWENDPMLGPLQAIDPTVVALPFNPTAENMADHLINVVGPQQLGDSGLVVLGVTVEETRKCSAAVRNR